MAGDDGTITIKLRGEQNLLNAINDMGSALKGDPIRRALRAAADRMRRVIVAFAPVGATQRLIENIVIGTRETAGVVHARVVVNTRGDRHDAQNAYYWRFLEFGWHDPAGVPHRIRFVQPAYDAEAADAAQTVINNIEAQLERTAAQFASEHGAE